MFCSVDYLRRCFSIDENQEMSLLGLFVYIDQAVKIKNAVDKTQEVKK